jgi:hypothetical protein
MVRRALVPDRDVRIGIDAFEKDFANARLANAGIAADKRDLAFAGFDSLPVSH